MDILSLTSKQRAKAAVMSVAFKLLGDSQSASVCFKAAANGQWEGSQQDRFRNRPSRRLAGQDTDLNFGAREDLLSEARSLEQTFPITKRIRSKFSDYCVGKVKIKWRTGDRNIDALYQQNWENAMTRIDAEGRHTFPKMTKLACGSMIGDGNVFGNILNVDSFCQVRAIEADRVSSSGIFNTDVYNPDGSKVIGGIGIGANGRAKFIRVWDRTLYGTFQNPVEIPRENYVHLFNSKRFDGALGVTAYHAVLNAQRDLKEISVAEIAAIKRNSKLALIYKTITGQAPAVNLMGDGAAPDSPTGVTMKEVNDSTDEYMLPGEEIEAHTFDRPGNNFIAMQEFIIRQIGLGVDLPFSVLWHMAGMGKPAILAELKDADRTFQSVMDEIEWKWIRPIVASETCFAIEGKRLPFHPNWSQFLVGRPPSITIDAGRDSKSGIDENKLALRSARSWFFETEEDWEEETEQCFIEESFRNEMLLKYPGVSIDRVRMMTPNGNSSGGGMMANATAGAE